ncbi:MAG TPA: hypothetical protein GXZ47_02910 [Treponema sp.]|nr:hypothetical protein [Treponema sp.]
MTLENRILLKRILSLVAAVVVFLFFIIFINTMTHHYSEETIRVAVKEVLEHNSEETISIIQKKRIPRTGISYNRIYEVAVGKKKSTVYVVTITGRAGPYSAVFSVKNPGTVDFCGLLLSSFLTESHEKYGITPKMIDHWETKIANIDARFGETK